MNAQQTPAVVCRNLHMGYGRESVLRGIDLDIPAGSFLPLVGPNGAGKTTLLRGILGLLKPTAGQIEVHQNGAGIGYVPQQESIDPLFPLTVEEIIRMGLYPILRWWGRPRAIHRERLRWALDEVGLRPHAGKNYRQLSGGMKQKALIARALVTGSDILIMDEPTSELDAPSEQEVIQYLHRASRKEGKTVLIACHGLQHAVLLADHVCLVEKGKARLVEASEAAHFVGLTSPPNRTGPATARQNQGEAP